MKFFRDFWHSKPLAGNGAEQAQNAVIIGSAIVVKPSHVGSGGLAVLAIEDLGQNSQGGAPART